LRRHRKTPGANSRFLTPGLVFVGMMVAVVSSLGAPLVPTVATTYHVSPSDAQWSLTVTFLVGSLATPAMGRLGDGPHRRAVIVGGLGFVVVGSVLAALPLGFAALLAGRALQGVGLGLTPLGIAVARDALPVKRARPVVAMLSVTTIAGVGLGYPITGLIAQYGGVHTAFWFGAVMSALGVVVAALVVPSSAHRPRKRLDSVGAVLLGTVLVGLLLAMSEGGKWGWTSPGLIAVVLVSLAALAVWIPLQLRLKHPLVELRLLRQRSVLTANVTTLLAGIGMYLLISVVTRLVQTPTDSGYGLGGSVLVAGLVLIPYSVGSLVAVKVVPILIRRISDGIVLPVGSVVVLLAMVMFTCARAGLWEIGVLLGVAGLGVGLIFTGTPSLILRSVPAHETGSATSFSQVIRYIGFSAGSALSAVALQAGTPPGQVLPADSEYTIAGLIGCALWIVTAVAALALPRLRARTAPRAGWEETQKVAYHELRALPHSRPPNTNDQLPEVRSDR
jgi:MFS family permease